MGASDLEISLCPSGIADELGRLASRRRSAIGSDPCRYRKGGVQVLLRGGSVMSTSPAVRARRARRFGRAVACRTSFNARSPAQRSAARRSDLCVLRRMLGLIQRRPADPSQGDAFGGVGAYSGHGGIDGCGARAIRSSTPFCFSILGRQRRFSSRLHYYLL
jgi:hypothetical protein